MIFYAFTSAGLKAEPERRSLADFDISEKTCLTAFIALSHFVE